MYKSQQSITKHTKQQGHSDQAKEWNQSLETDPKNTCISELPEKLSIHQEDRTIIKLYALNIRVPKYKNQTWQIEVRNRQFYNKWRELQYSYFQ